MDLPGSYDGGKPDLVWDGKNIPLPDRAVESVLATEVFEHCPEPESLMREIHRVLKPQGFLFFTTPFFGPFTMFLMMNIGIRRSRCGGI